MASTIGMCRECERGSYRCDGCRRHFCDLHLAEHRQTLSEQVTQLTHQYAHLSELLSLPPSYESLTENTDLIAKVDQWEAQTIQSVKDVAERTRERLRQRAEVLPNDRFAMELQRLREQLQQLQRSSQTLEPEIDRLTTQMAGLKTQVEESVLTTADIRSTPIDWSNHLQVIGKQQNRPGGQQREVHFDRLLTTKARVSLEVKGFDWHVLGTACPSNSTFLHYQHSKKHRRLSLVDGNGEQKPIAWYDDQSVWDSCWSTFLRRFFVLSDNQLYTYDDTLNTSDSLIRVDAVKTKRTGMEFLRCACANETLFITYDERNSSIDEYDMNGWRNVHQHENVVQPNEIIISIAACERNANLVGLTVLDDRQHWHFESRDRSMRQLTSVALDKSEFNRRLISLPNATATWLIVHTGTKVFTIMDENAQAKRTVDCAENIDLATYIPARNCLVVLTQKNKLKFFDL